LDVTQSKPYNTYTTRQENIYLHLDEYPIIFGEIETSYFNIEIPIILHEIKMYFNYLSQRI